MTRTRLSNPRRVVPTKKWYCQLDNRSIGFVAGSVAHMFDAAEQIDQIHPDDREETHFIT